VALRCLEGVGCARWAVPRRRGPRRRGRRPKFRPPKFRHSKVRHPQVRHPRVRRRRIRRRRIRRRPTRRPLVHRVLDRSRTLGPPASPGRPNRVGAAPWLGPRALRPGPHVVGRPAECSGLGVAPRLRRRDVPLPAFVDTTGGLGRRSRRTGWTGRTGRKVRIGRTAAPARGSHPGRPGPGRHRVRGGGSPCGPTDGSTMGGSTMGAGGRVQRSRPGPPRPRTRSR
jgi:hypothetical protein